MPNERKSLAIDRDIHEWIKAVADKNDVHILDVVRDLYLRYRDDGPSTNFQQLRLRRELEKLNQRKAAILDEEKRLQQKMKEHQS